MVAKEVNAGMSADEPADWGIEIVPPGGQVIRPDRRRSAAVFRPYSPRDGRAPGDPAVTNDRRRRRRATAEPGRGRRIDLES